MRNATFIFQKVFVADCHALPYDVVQMNEGTIPKKKETGVRLYEDQIQKLDMLVTLGNGRKDRSTLIREAIDNLLAQRLGGAVAA